jgi:hypothetical protein
MKIRKSLKTLHNKDGFSMVNVLVAFAMLLLMVIIFSNAMNLALKLYEKSKQIRETDETLYGAFYRNTKYSVTTGDISTDKKTYTFSDGSTTFTIDSSLGDYKQTDGDVYFFGQRNS